MSYWVYTDSARAGEGERPIAVSGICERCQQPKAAHVWTCSACRKPLAKGDATPSLHTYRNHPPGMRHSSTALLLCEARPKPTSLAEARAYLAAHGGLRLPGMGGPSPSPPQAQIKPPQPDQPDLPAAEQDDGAEAGAELDPAPCPACKAPLGRGAACPTCNNFRLAMHQGGTLDIGPSQVTAVDGQPVLE